MLEILGLRILHFIVLVNSEVNQSIELLRDLSGASMVKIYSLITVIRLSIKGIAFMLYICEYILSE